MTFMARTSAAVFQSSFSRESITAAHEALGGDARQLRHAVEVFEGIGEAFEAAVFQEAAQAIRSWRHPAGRSEAAPPLRKEGGKGISIRHILSRDGLRQRRIWH